MYTRTIRKASELRARRIQRAIVVRFIDIYERMGLPVPYTGTRKTRGGGGRVLQKNWVRVCGPLPKTLTLFMTKICDFSYPIYDLK